MVEAAFVAHFPIPPSSTLPYISNICCGTIWNNVRISHKYCNHIGRFHCMKISATCIKVCVTCNYVHNVGYSHLPVEMGCSHLSYIASAVPEYGHFPSSSLSHPAVS